MSNLSDIRATFLDFFAAQGHEIVPAAPLVPRNDPTLMFTNAGMVQFKNLFTGQEQRAYQRAASSQKCVRAGGKHNDLDNVGYTARHLTFFEMLGNFSFGDYFKEAAIDFAWQLVTRELGLSTSRLCVTVYAEDEEAFDLWRRITDLPEQQIIRIGTADNFWSMGDTGPCGPCSEIFYDHGEDVPGGPPGSPDEDGDRFVEIWNLVFMQYEQMADGSRIALPKPSIDTGMGLERIGAVLQGVHNVFETDLLSALVLAAQDAIGTAPTVENIASYRVIADHLRSSGFLIADGVLPSNEGRGYVLRRIMRRAMRHAEMLGAHEPVLWQLTNALVTGMGAHYGELRQAQALIEETIELEEIRFRKTLDRGLKLLDDEAAELAAGDRLSGAVAFKLYDTYGFPLDLTQDALRNRGISVDTEAFEAAMAKQRADARAAWSGSGETATDAVWYSILERVGASEFLGYEADEAEALVTAIVIDGEEVQATAAGAEVALLLNQTPFYAESGGQVGDCGELSGLEGARVDVRDTQKLLGELHVHIGTLRGGGVRVGDVVKARIDVARRDRIRANHSATHLLHAALRRVLGDHVTQKGSLVEADRLRFDFAHNKPLSDAECHAIEAEVNAVIRQNAVVSTRIMSPEEAIDAGAMALFGEKYGEAVRVLSMGQDPQGEAAYSTELCGGTHVARTGDIALLHILGDSAVGAGVRRMEALTGEAARAFLEKRDDIVLETAQLLKTAPDELSARVAALVAERRKLERELGELRKKLALSDAAGGQAQAGGSSEPAAERIGDTGFVARILNDVPAKELRGLIDTAKQSLGSGVAVFIAVNEGKAGIAVGVTDDLTDRFDAVELVRAGAQLLGGKGGGGRPDMAQAGGPDGDKAAAAIDAIRQNLSEKQAAG